MELTKKTIIDNIEDRNKNNMNVTSFESLGGNSIDYKTFFELVEVYAKGFKELGVGNNDIVTLCTAGTLDTVLYFAALNKIGAVTQFVNPNYFKYNSKKYINNTNSKLLICLDKFYPLIKDAIKETNVEQILLSSLSEYSSYLYKLLIRRKKISNQNKIDNIKYIDFFDFIKLGKNSNLKINRINYEKDKPAVITYTSGTTGDPKGVVHTNDSLNNMISIYEIANGFGIRRNERNLVLIPPMYLTSFMHSIFGPNSMGATNILQPIYNPKTLGKDLKKYEPKTVVASKAHYINLEDSKLPKGSLNKTVYAYCGGEAISKSIAIKINKILEYYGINPMVIGYGQTEFGTMTMFNYDIPNRVNESGILIPNVEAKILDLVTGKEVKEGQRGELYIKTPTVMKEYLDNPIATNEFLIKDNNEEIWAKTGDIAEVKYKYKGKKVYEVSGRISDSFIDNNGNVIYLFDIETAVEDIKYVKEAEVVALTVNGIKVPIVHLILNKNTKESIKEIIKLIDYTLRKKSTNPNSIPYAYKVRTSFSTSPISGKRDYEILKYETEGYLRINDNNEIEKIKIDSIESQNKSNIVQSKILVKK